jgi:hypothetical protein
MVPTDGWKRGEQMARNRVQGASKWLKLVNDGDKAVVVFLGQPYPREAVFVDGKYARFDDSHRVQGLKASLRFAFNVALYDSKEVKVFEQGVTVFNDLVRLRDKYDLGTRAFEIQRHGKPKDSNTKYVILPEDVLTPEQQKEFQALDLYDLAELYGDSAVAQPAPAGQGGGPAAVDATRPTPPTTVPQADDDRDLPF